MPVWEYKVISSGKGGFASPALLETFLNQLGKDDWEIIHYQTPPDNPLAFMGLARRSTQRDWTLEDAAAAAARAETEKLRAEFEAKFRGAAAAAGAAEERSEPTAEGKSEPEDDGFRKPRDTERDMENDADEEEADEWDQLAGEEQLPTFFDAVQPLMRRNPKGVGMSVGLDQLAKKWHLSEEDIVGALKECGFTIPEDEDAKPGYLEYDGDLFWVNINRRGEIWINTKEKPRAVFRVAAGTKVAGESVEAEAPVEHASAAAATEPEAAAPAADAPAPKASGGGALPEGEALLRKIRPLMRRGRGGASGSLGFLSRALRCRENDLADAFKTLGLVLADESGRAPDPIELGGRHWWLNKDQRGGIWINEGRRGDRPATGPGGEAASAAPAAEPEAGVPPAATPPIGETPGEAPGPISENPPVAAAAATEISPVSAEPSSGEPSAEASAEATAPLAPVSPTPPEQAAEGDELLAAVRPLLKEGRSGALTAEICTLGESLDRNPEKMLQALSGLGLRIPDKPREKAVEIERAGLTYWLSRNAKDEIWLNMREAGAEGADERKPRRPRRPAAASGPSEPTPSE